MLKYIFFVNIRRCRIVEDKSNIRLCENSINKGNKKEQKDPLIVFKDWTYTTDIKDGSYLVKHLNYDNEFEKYV